MNLEDLMVTTDYTQAFLKAKKLPCFAHLSKNIHIPAGYCIINPDTGKYYGQVSPEYDFKSHEEAVKEYHHYLGSNPEWCYFDDRVAHFFFRAGIKFDINEYKIDVYTEIVNSYDGHTARENYISIKINDAYLFTDLSSELTSLGIKGMFDKLAVQKVTRTFVPSEKLPKHLSLPTESQWAMGSSKIDYLYGWSKLIDVWKNTSFLIARKTSIKLFNHIISA
jgi:hypothetical protein